jgi:threonyl-tRNA synthetase
MLPYAQEVAARMRALGVRVDIPPSASIAKLIRNAEKAKTPVMCVVGAKEVDAGTLSVRLYGGADLGALPADEVINRLVLASASKSPF